MRLTSKDTYGHWIVSLYDENGKCQYPQAIINRLAAYEDSGYEPEEIVNLDNNNSIAKGVWYINPDGYYPYCSRCKEEPKSGELSKFCPNCGADMRRDKND